MINMHSNGAKPHKAARAMKMCRLGSRGNITDEADELQWAVTIDITTPAQTFTIGFDKELSH